MIKPGFITRSVRNRIAFFICLLLLFIVVVFGWSAYVGVRQQVLEANDARMKVLSTQFTNMLGKNTSDMLASTARIAIAKPVKDYFIDTNSLSNELQLILSELRKDTTIIAVQLKNREGRNLRSHFKPGINIDDDITTEMALLENTNTLDSGVVGRLRQSGNLIYAPIILSIKSDTSVLGYVVRWRKVNTTKASLEQIEALVGKNVKLYLGNADGSLWTDLIGPSEAPGKIDHTGSITSFTRKERGLVFASMRSIPNSFWTVSVELPSAKVMETSNRLLGWLITAGIAILITGFVSAWLLSRNFTKPVSQITKAASAIAAGNYNEGVPIHRRDELGKLARAFHSMAERIRSSQKRLEENAYDNRLLFELNPMPMWIMARSNLRIIDVNESAIYNFGYSREEFLSLDAVELRPVEDQAAYLDYLNNHKKGIQSRIWKLKRNDGSTMMAEVYAEDIHFRGKEARLVLANDVTEKLRAESELIRHRVMQQKLITETTILAQEKEREELGKELHDNINQILASTKLYLELAQTENETTFKRAIAKSYENVNLAIGEIRQLSRQLVPPSLDQSLEDEIRAIVEDIQSVAPIEFHLDFANFSESELHNKIKLSIYRIVQEQINNILKHAYASQVLIQLISRNSEVRLLIRDNGVGFDVNSKPRGIGLRNIDNRVKFYNGTTTINSSEGNGCLLIASIPLSGDSL